MLNCASVTPVFSRMDYGESGEINFEEYVFSIWDFLTNDLHHFVFQVFGKWCCFFVGIHKT